MQAANCAHFPQQLRYCSLAESHTLCVNNSNFASCNMSRSRLSNARDKPPFAKGNGRGGSHRSNSDSEDSRLIALSGGAIVPSSSQGRRPARTSGDHDIANTQFHLPLRIQSSLVCMCGSVRSTNQRIKSLKLRAPPAFLLANRMKLLCRQLPTGRSHG